MWEMSVMLEFNRGADCDLAAVLLIQLHANVSRKAKWHDTSAWALATDAGDLEEAPDFRLAMT